MSKKEMTIKLNIKRKTGEKFDKNGKYFPLDYKRDMLGSKGNTVARNPTIFNIIPRFTGSLGRMTHQPRV